MVVWSTQKINAAVDLIFESAFISSGQRCTCARRLILPNTNNGKKILNETLKEWDLDYDEKKSLTSDDSFILNIKKIRKKVL